MSNKELIGELIPFEKPLTSRFRKKYVETLALGILQYCYKEKYDGFEVHDSPDISRELKEGADILPVVFPITDRIGIFLSPLLFYIFQLRKCGSLIRGIVYRLEIRGELLQVIVIHIFKRVTQHMDDTPLYLSLRINSLNCIFKARKPIYTEEQYLFHTTVS